MLRSHPKQRQLVLVIYLVHDGTMLRLLTPKKGDHQEIIQDNGQKVGVVTLSLGIDLIARQKPISNKMHGWFILMHQLSTLGVSLCTSH